MTLGKSLILALLLAVLGPAPAFALDPLPDVYYGPGYISWELHQDAPTWRLETLLERLRDPRIKDRQAAMKSIGFEKIRVGRTLMFPEIVQPIHVEQAWLGIERRKLAVLTMPVKGKHAWAMIVLRQDGNDADYWRPVQFLKFDTNPVDGLVTSFPDINGEQIYFLRVKHVTKDDIYGYKKVDSIFKFDEKQLRLTFQEADDFYRVGQHQGDGVKLAQELVFRNDQRIVRRVTVRTYPYMADPEFFKYEEPNVKPRKTETFEESFSWTPQYFSFYDPRAELEKLVTHKSVFVRREAARRLGEVLTSTHPQLEKAMLTDKDGYVRAQCALALENIGDPAALPSLEKALKRFDEDESIEDSYQRAFKALSEAASKVAPEKSPEPEAKPAKESKAVGKAPEAGKAPEPEGPKITERK